jgi:hypothetical protein
MLSGNLKTHETTPVIELAMQKVVASMERRNVLSPEHHQALLGIIGNIVLQASGQNPGRHVARLDTGMGKTSCVLAVLSAMYECGVPWPILVCASKVEQLCTLYRGLTNSPDDREEPGYGMPKDIVGLWFKAQRFDPEVAEQIKNGTPRDGYTSEQPTTEHHTKQFLLCTHNRVRGQRDSADSQARLREMLHFTTAKGDRIKRPCVIWDESLIVSDSLYVNLADLAEQFKGYQARSEYFGKVTKTPELGSCLEWIDECLKTLRREYKAQENRYRPKLVMLPQRDEQTIEGYKQVVPASWRREESAFTTLCDMAHMPLRLVVPKQGPAVVTFRIAVPPEMDDIIVLDASWPIRTALRLDPTLNDLSRLPGVDVLDKPLKSYDLVELKTITHGSGKDTVKRNFGRKEREQRTVSQEICGIVTSLPPDEAVLIFVPKANGVDCAKILSEDLRDAGVNLDSPFVTNDPGYAIGRKRKRINIATWGMETADNAWSHCQHVILASTQRRADGDMAALKLAQEGKLDSVVTDADVETVENGEVLHTIYQALSRGACRETINGQAKRMVGYLIHPSPDAVVRGLREVMPVGHASPAETQHIEQPAVVSLGQPHSSSLIQEYAETVMAFLNRQPETVTSVSSFTIKQECSLRLLSFRRWQSTVEAVCAAASAWSFSGRSFTRKSSPFPRA